MRFFQIFERIIITLSVNLSAFLNRKSFELFGRILKC